MVEKSELAIATSQPQ